MTGQEPLFSDKDLQPPEPPKPPTSGCQTCHGNGYDRNPAIPYLKRCYDCDYWTRDYGEFSYL